MSSILRTFLSGIANKGIPNTIHYIKNNFSYNELCELLDSNSSAVSNNIQCFVGRPYPKNYEELGVVPYIFESNSLENEIDWLFLALRHETEGIRKFLELKGLFEKHILFGDYENAKIIITKIENEICVSLWSLENRLLLAQLTDGTAGNKKLLKEMQPQIEDIDVKFLSIYYSERVEPERGVSQFGEKILAAFNQYDESNRDALISYFTFKLDPYENISSDLNPVLTCEFKFSLIDRYLTMVKIFTYAANGIIQFNFSPFIYKIKRIAVKTKDQRLINLWNNLKKDWIHPFVEYNSANLLCHQYYLQGMYKDCYEMSKELINKNPNDFEIIKIHLKSSIHLDINNYDISSNIVLEKIFSVIRCIYAKDKVDIFGPLLVKLAFVLESHEIGIKVFHFFTSEVYNDNTFAYTARSYLHSSSPHYYKNYTESDKNFCLEKQIKEIPSFFSFKYYQNVINHDFESNKQLVSDNGIRIKFLEIDKLIAQNRFPEQILLLHSLIIDIKKIGYIYEKAIRRLYNAYVKNSQISDAINLYVNNYMESEALVRKFDTSYIIKENKKFRLKNVSPSIYLPIFYYSVKAEEVDINNSLRLFLFDQNVKKPSSLKLEHLNAPLSQIEYLLEMVCIPEVLNHSSVFNSRKEILIERINILNRLIEWNPTKTSVYEKEIQENAKKLIILDGIKKLDESKIYINEEGLYDAELKAIEPVFSRLLSLIKIYDENDINTEADEITGKNIPAYFNETLAVSFTAIIPSFKELFLIIRNQYLFSQYGLINYLSTRIRHGILEDAIRSVYQKLGLITAKDTTGSRYMTNTNWDNELTSNLVSLEKIDKFHAELATFSALVDNYILNHILALKIQIKTESKNKDGLFDYSYNDNEISDLLLNKRPLATNFKQFVYQTYDELYERTENNLKIIQPFLVIDVFTHLTSLITALEENVQRVIKKDILNNFFVQTNLCREALQRELEKISNWFVMSDTQMTDCSFSDIIDITNEYLQSSILHKNLKIEKKLCSNLIVKGKYYVPLSDLFRLFMVNALKYSNLSDPVVPLIISTSEIDQETIQIQIINFLDTETDLESLRARIQLFKNRSNDLETLTGEGSSGLLKARNILKSDFKNSENEVDYFINSSNQFEVNITLKHKEICI